MLKKARNFTRWVALNGVFLAGNSGCPGAAMSTTTGDMKTSSETGESSVSDPTTMATPTTSSVSEGESTTIGSTSSSGGSSTSGSSTTISPTEPTTGSPTPECGNGIEEEGEACDATHCKDKATDVEFEKCMRSLVCKMNCSFLEKTCTPCEGCCQPATCGDGVENTSSKSAAAASEECDDGNDDEDDGCRKCFLDRRVFVTDAVYCGDLGEYLDGVCKGNSSKEVGVERGDERCREAAESAVPMIGDVGNMKSWLSVGDEDQPANRFNAANKENLFAGRYVMVGEQALTTVAYGWDGLTAVNDMMAVELVNAIVIDQAGAKLETAAAAWTSTTTLGVTTAATCGEWASTDGQGGYGRVLESVKGEIWTYNSDVDCSFPARLYCFEDPPAP